VSFSPYPFTVFGRGGRVL